MSEWVEVFVTYDEIEAEILQGLLESGGIPVVVRSAKVTPYPVNVGKMGEVKVLVKRESKAAAEELIREISKDSNAEHDKEGSGPGKEVGPG